MNIIESIEKYLRDGEGKLLYESTHDDIENTKVLDRTKSFWEKIAKENLEVDQIKGTLYAYGSELATLRLFKYYNIVKRNIKTNADYSSNLRKFYFRLEI